jgi:predicted RNA-binding protein YlqC (UPF0109 family)
MVDGTESMKELIQYITHTLVDYPDQVEVTELTGNQTNVIELKVAKDDIGKIIGRSGRTANAIRTILNCASTKLNRRYILHIIDE